VHRECLGGGRTAVLTIGKLGSSPDQLGYYEQQVAQGLEDYCSGRGAVVVGATGDVDRAAFMRAWPAVIRGPGTSSSPRTAVRGSPRLT